MANRFFNQFNKTLEKEVCSLFAKISFGSTGAPTLDATNSKGVSSISRTSTGLYVLTLTDNYNRLFGVNATWDTSGASGSAPVGPIVYLSAANAVSTLGAATITFKTGDYVNGAVADPASGEVLYLEINLKNSNAF